VPAESKAEATTASPAQPANIKVFQDARNGQRDRKMTRQITAPDSRITQFCALIFSGIEAWIKAGKLLCEMKTENPEVFFLIRVERPELTIEILETFERIGRQEIYPYLVADGSPGARHLMALPYGEQRKIYEEGVLVVTKRGAQIKKVSQLSLIELGRVFDGERIRSEKEQSEILRHRRRASLVARARTEENGNEDDPTLLLKADLGAEPTSELARLLGLANAIMIECRSLLAMVKRESKKDTHITNALIEIGSLRFAVNEGEL